MQILRRIGYLQLVKQKRRERRFICISELQFI